MKKKYTKIKTEDINKWYQEYEKIIEQYKYAIVCNVKFNSNEQEDFFSLDEFDSIINIAHTSKMKIEFILGEKDFINRVVELSEKKHIVLNLSRQGSDFNKKSVVHAICDLYDIPCISSSCYTVNLCRHKAHFAQILKNKVSTVIETEVISDKNRIGISKFLNKTVFVKKIQSAGSEGIAPSHKFQLKDINNTLLQFHNNEYVIQNFINGLEIEVPFIICQNTIYICNIYQIVMAETAFLSNELSNTFNYKINRIDVEDLTDIADTITAIVNELGITCYGRADFRMTKENGVPTYHLFDIATTPFFIEHTSFYKSIQDITTKHTIIDILFYVKLLEMM